MSCMRRALSYIGYQQLPDDLDNRRILTVVGAFQAWGAIVARIMSYFGRRDSDLRLTRWAFPPRSRSLTEPYIRHGVEVSESEFGGVAVRLYEPLTLKDEKQRPAVIYYHGGGWFMANAETFDPLMVYFAHALQAVVVSVEYRLVPENPFPIPPEDCFQATKYVFEHAQQLGIDSKRIILFGDSAGGHLAAVVSLKFRDENLPYRPRLQVLINPMLQGVTFNLPSYKRDFSVIVHRRGLAKCYIFANEKFKDRRDINDVAKQMALDQHISTATKRQVATIFNFLPEEFKKDHEPADDHGTNETLQSDMEAFVLDPYVSPLFADNLTGLPETYLWVAGYDMLRDEGILYAKRLEQAGNSVTLVVQPTAHHGGWAFNTDTGNQYKKETFEFIKLRLENTDCIKTLSDIKG